MIIRLLLFSGFGTIASVGDSVSQKKLVMGDKVVDICTYSM